MESVLHPIEPWITGWNFNGSAATEAALKPFCQEVEEQFTLPPKRLYRYFAAWDDGNLQQQHGQHYRGFHAPRASRNILPLYLLNCFYRPFNETYGMPFEETIAFDNLIYIRSVTCLDVVGAVITYGHELQHFVQHGFTPKLSSVNFALYENLKLFEPAAIPTDIPHEREANIVSKRVAEIVCGVGAVRTFAEKQVLIMERAGEEEQKARFVFFRDVPSSTKYDLVQETLRLVEKYRGRIDFGVDTTQPEWWVA